MPWGREALGDDAAAAQRTCGRGLRAFGRGASLPPGGTARSTCFALQHERLLNQAPRMHRARPSHRAEAEEPAAPLGAYATSSAMPIGSRAQRRGHVTDVAARRRAANIVLKTNK